MDLERYCKKTEVGFKVHKLNKMSNVELEEFLTRQKETTSFTFTMTKTDETEEEIVLKNEPKAFEFLKAYKDETFELKEASELI